MVLLGRFEHDMIASLAEKEVVKKSSKRDKN